MSDLLILKQQFVDKLSRLKKAMDYADSDNPDKWKWQPTFMEILREVSDIECQLRQSCCIMSDEEIHRTIENL